MESACEKMTEGQVSWVNTSGFEQFITVFFASGDGTTVEELALRIGVAVFGEQGDPVSYCEALYHTSTGRFVILGSGGRQTHWAHQIGKSDWIGSGGMIQITESDALNWCEIHEDSLDEHFDVENHFDLGRFVDIYEMV